MDFFNFLYKLSNIFANKRRLKFFIVVGLILLFLFACSKGVFAATTQDVEALTNYQLAMQEAIFSQLTDLVRTGTINPTAYGNFINNLKTNFVYVTTSTNNNAQAIIYLYRINRVDNGVVYNSPQDFTTEGSWSVGINAQGQGSTQYDCMLAQFKGPTFVFYYGTPAYLSTATFSTFWLPDACFCVRSTAVNNFLEACSEVSDIPTTYSTSDEELQAITSSGFANVTNSINSQTSSLTNSIATTNNELSEANDNLNSINNEVSATNDFLNDTFVDDSIVSLPSENNEDVTLGFFTGLLQTFTDNFTSRTIREVEVPIPFTTKKFYINNRFINSLVENNSKFAPIVNLAYAFWWFLLGYYVLIDVYRKINALKSGDLTNIENDNITTDLL